MCREGGDGRLLLGHLCFYQDSNPDKKEEEGNALYSHLHTYSPAVMSFVGPVKVPTSV